jgi:hypothetical protein
MNDIESLSEFQTLARFLSRYEAQIEGRGQHSESPEVLALTEAWVRGELSKDQREVMITKTLEDRDLEARLVELIRGQRQSNPGLPA